MWYLHRYRISRCFQGVANRVLLPSAFHSTPSGRNENPLPFCQQGEILPIFSSEQEYTNLCRSTGGSHISDRHFLEDRYPLRSPHASGSSPLKQTMAINWVEIMERVPFSVGPSTTPFSLSITSLLNLAPLYSVPALLIHDENQQVQLLDLSRASFPPAEVLQARGGYLLPAETGLSKALAIASWAPTHVWNSPTHQAPYIQQWEAVEKGGSTQGFPTL